LITVPLQTPVAPPPPCTIQESGMHLHHRHEIGRANGALGMALLVGMGLLWPLPVGGALLMVTAGFGLAILWETELGEPVPSPALVEPATPRREG
jgi:hypothetical protein